MKLGRTEQWLILAVMIAAAAWVGMMVWARLQPDAHAEASRPADAGPAAPAETAAPVASAPSDMVFSVDDLATTAAPATAAPASAIPAAASAIPATASTAPTTAAPATTAPATTAPATVPGRSPSVLVRSSPTGARIMDAQTLLGRTPMELPRPTEFTEVRHLSIQKTGYRSARISIGPGSPARIDVELEEP